MTPAAHRMWAATHEQHASLSDLVLLLAQELGCAQTDPQLLVAADETLRFMDRAGLVVAVTP